MTLAVITWQGVLCGRGRKISPWQVFSYRIWEGGCVFKP